MTDEPPLTHAEIAEEAVWAAEHAVRACPACNGSGEALGALGSLYHYQCRHCGILFHTGDDQ